MSEVILKGIKKIYDNKVTAVHDVNLKIADKEFIVLVGPSGCGKSTTLRMVAGLEDISEGELYIDGNLMNDIVPKDRDIAMVFQNYALYPHMTVRDNMAFALKLKRTPKAEIDAKVKEVANILGITQYLDRKPKALSGGQRQRLSLARTVAKDAKVYIFDDTFSALDAKTESYARNSIMKMLEGKTVLMVAQKIDTIKNADQIIVLDRGRIVGKGSHEKLLNSCKEYQDIYRTQMYTSGGAAYE